MTDSTLADLAEANLIRSIESFARAARGDVHDDGVIHVSTAPVPMRSFN